VLHDRAANMASLRVMHVYLHVRYPHKITTEHFHSDYLVEHSLR